MKNIKLKKLKVMKFTSKTRSTHLLLKITYGLKFEDFVLIVYNWLLNIAIEGTMQNDPIETTYN